MSFEKFNHETVMSATKIDIHKEIFYFICRNILSIISGTVLSVIFLWIYGYILVLFKNGYLAKKAAFIEKTGGIALPSTHNLSSLSSVFLFNSGAFIGLSLGVFWGVSISLVIVIARLIPSYQLGKVRLRWTEWLLFIIGITMCCAAGKDFYPFITLPVFIMLPFAAYTGYLLPSYIIGQPQTLLSLSERGEKYNMVKLKNHIHIYAISLLIFLSSGFFLFLYIKYNPVDYIKIRDNFLLTNRAGNYVNSFYYTHSPFAAETIKPLKAKAQFTALYIGDDLSAIRYLKRYKKKMWLFLDTASNREEIAQSISSGGADIFIIGSESEDMYDYLFDTYHIKDHSLLLLPANSKDTLSDKYKIPKLVMPINLKKIRKAIGQLSEASDRAKGIRHLIKLALFDYIWIVILAVMFLAILFTVSISACILDILLRLPYPKSAIAVFCLSLLAAVYPVKERLKKRCSANRIMQTLLKKRDINLLIEYLNGEDSELRYQSSVILAKISKNNKNFRLFNVFIKALDDKDPRVRIYSLIGLGKLGQHKAVPKLINMLDDSQINVRYKAAEALGKIGSPLALQPLKRLIRENRIWYVSDYALRAFRRIKQ